MRVCVFVRFDFVSVYIFQMRSSFFGMRERERKVCFFKCILYVCVSDCVEILS